jgi:hypothetical protein
LAAYSASAISKRNGLNSSLVSGEKIMNKIVTGMACCALLTIACSSVGFAQTPSGSTKKGEKLEQQSQQEENKAVQQEREGHPLRAGRDAKKAARKAAHADKELAK